METAICFIVGIFGGVVCGILPGVGGIVLMTMALPWLMTLDPVNILVFYVCLVSVDQYFNEK